MIIFLLIPINSGYLKLSFWKKKIIAFKKDQIFQLFKWKS